MHSTAAAARVQTLTLRPHLFGRDMPVSRPLKGLSLKSVSRKASRLFTRGKPANPSTALASNLLQKITKMTNVTSVIVGCYTLDDCQMFKNASSFLDAAWTHSSQLRTLTLAIPLEAMAHILPSMPKFDVLEELSLTLRFAYHNSEQDDILTHIAAFANRHASTLTKLSIDTPQPNVDPSSLYQALDLYPRLSSVSIAHPVERLEPQKSTGVDSFLAKRADSLRELKVQLHGPVVDQFPPSPEVLFSHPIFKIPFPHLKVLELGLCQWEKSFQPSVQRHLTQYIAQLSSILSDLVLRGYVFSFPEVHEVVTKIGGDGSTLRSLQLHTHFLSCDLLDLLSRELPNLHSLDLSFNSLSSKDDGSWNHNYYWNGLDVSSSCLASEFWPMLICIQEKATTFVNDVRLRKYYHWKLRHIELQPLHYCSGRWQTSQRLLVGCLPFVETFNGQSSSEFSTTPDYTKSS